MSNLAFLFLPLAFSSLPAVLPFVSPSSQVCTCFLCTFLARAGTHSCLLLLCPHTSSRHGPNEGNEGDEGDEGHEGHESHEGHEVDEEGDEEGR